MNRTEYRRMLYLTLMKSKVAQAVDSHAQDVVAQVEQLIAEKEGDLWAVSEALGAEVEYEATGQLVDNMNVDGGRSNKAMTLEVNQVSDKFLSSNGDGYYYVKLAEKTEDQVNYSSIKVTFSEFDLQVASLYDEGKVKEYITFGNLQIENGAAETPTTEE